MEKINAGEKLYMHVSTATAGFKGTFTYTSVKAGTESLVKELPSAYTYVENGLNQYAATAKVNLPADVDFSKYKTCRIDFTASDLSFEFHGIVGHKVNGAEVTDPQYGAVSKGMFQITLNNVLKENGTDPFVVINAGKAGYAGKVKILRVALLPEGQTVPDITIDTETIRTGAGHRDTGSRYVKRRNRRCYEAGRDKIGSGRQCPWRRSFFCLRAKWIRSV